MCVWRQDTNADAATRDWLFNMTDDQRPRAVASNRASRRFSAFDRPPVRLTILGAFSRLAGVGHRSPDLPPNEVHSMHIIVKRVVTRACCEQQTAGQLFAFQI